MARLTSRWDDSDDGVLELELSGAGLELDASGLWIDPDQNLGAVKHEGHAVVGTVSIEWCGAAPPPDFVLSDPVHLARRVDAQRLSEVIDRARAAGIAQRQKCRFCGERLNPGWMHEDDVCQGCAEQHLGVIH